MKQRINNKEFINLIEKKNILFDSCFHDYQNEIYDTSHYEHKFFTAVNKKKYTYHIQKILIKIKKKSHFTLCQ